MNIYGRLQRTILLAIFEADTAEEGLLAHLPLCLRLVADFVEHNGIRNRPSRFETFEAFAGAHHQWNHDREMKVDMNHEKGETE